MDNDFDSVSWRNDPDGDTPRPTTGGSSQPEETTYGAKSSGKRKANHSSSQAGADADAVDLAGIGDGRLDCTVDTPLKENDGTKDAYVSYLVTTTVRSAMSNILALSAQATHHATANNAIVDRFPLL